MPEGMKTSKTFTSGGRLLPECTNPLKNGGAPGPLGDYIMQTSPWKNLNKRKKRDYKIKKENFVFLFLFLFTFFSLFNLLLFLFFSFMFFYFLFFFLFIFFLCKRRLTIAKLFKECSEVLDFQKGKYQVQNCWNAAYFEVRVKKWISTLVFLLLDLQLLKF